MARDFNGTTSDYLNCGSPSYLNFTGNAMTASIWARKHTTSGSKIVGKWHHSTGQQWLIELGNDDLIFALYIDGSGVQILNSNASALTLNVWHHIVATYDGSAMKIYVDGTEQGTRSQSGNIQSRPSTDLTIGIGSSLNGPFNGELGHVALWDVTLSAEEIESLSNGINPLQIRTSSLSEYWPINGANPEPGIVNKCNATVNGTTVAEEPPMPNSIKAP